MKRVLAVGLGCLGLLLAPFAVATAVWGEKGAVAVVIVATVALLSLMLGSAVVDAFESRTRR